MKNQKPLISGTGKNQYRSNHHPLPLFFFDVGKSFWIIHCLFRAVFNMRCTHRLILGHRVSQPQNLCPIQNIGLARSGSLTVCPRTRSFIYIYYIHPELRIGNCRFRSGKGAGPLQREHRGSKGEQRGSTREQRGSTREHRGSRGAQ